MKKQKKRAEARFFVFIGFALRYNRFVNLKDIPFNMLRKG